MSVNDQAAAGGTNERPVPYVFVLFGATGDLAKRKLLPGLYQLYKAQLLPSDFRVIGSGRHSPGSDEEFRELVRQALIDFGDGEPEPAMWREFGAKFSFQTSSAEDGQELAGAVERAELQLGSQVQRLVYLSVPPTAMESMVGMLGRTGIARGARLVIEKPFGTDLPSARSLNAALHEVFDEERIFRIDHFLGKEAVQNILATRLGNGLLEPLWNRDRVSYVQIDVPETLTIEGRASFYESTGAFRDMVSTHLFQLLGFVAMEPPARMNPTALRDEKSKVFQAIRPLCSEDAVFGQYQDYRDEDGVDPASEVETFVALRVFIDNWRWAGVPFLLRTGKAMAQSRRTITVGLQDPPLRLFQLAEQATDAPNELVFELTDEPRMSVDLRVKRPGPALALDSARMRVDFAEDFAGADALEAYERLLHDVMRGDRTLFTRSDEVERIWELSDPLLAAGPKVRSYPRGSWGPPEARDLPGGRGWRLGEPS